MRSGAEKITILIKYKIYCFTFAEKFASFDKEFDSLAEHLALPRNLTELLGWSDSENKFTDEIVSKIVRR